MDLTAQRRCTVPGRRSLSAEGHQPDHDRPDL